MRNTIEMLFAAGTTNGSGLEWVKACYSLANGGFDVYSDPATIRRDGNVVRMWHLHDFKSAQVLTDTTYHSAINWVEYDCNSQRRRTLYVSLNSKNMGSGDSVYRKDIPSEWRPVATGSIAETLWKLAVGRRSAGNQQDLAVEVSHLRWQMRKAESVPPSLGLGRSTILRAGDI